ncbi:ATPase family AAA domain-containing protein 5b isoform X2 [Kryptolebias marmoratus]|uniref:ATPase family AAA domain-containing protein 5b isoform X2 n=1 Tax=Kryptolebias marmoratus TaxID=37003 RepID=UPI0007F8B9AC|nr:ATPase family AAA domain-containing protein 5b isoform X2 [Kryptolebias marmoratus]
MRRKLKRSSVVRGSASKNPRAEVIVLSESSCSEDEKHPAAHGEEKRGTALKTAPIFLRTNQIRRSKHSSARQAAQRPELPPDDVVRSPPTVPRGPVVSSWRGQLPSSCLQRGLQDIRASNAAVPLQSLFKSLQKKSGPRLQEFGSSDSLQKHLKEKRKRGHEISEGFAKRLRSSPCPLSGQGVRERTVYSGRKQAGGNKLSRTHRLKQQSERADGTTSVTQSLTASDVIHGDSCSGGLLWTDKYSPKQSSEVVGHSASVNKLHSWLKKWKLRADRDERRRAEERKREENSSDSWDCGDFQGEAALDDGGEEALCNAMLLTGPPGVGKTASVYACAQELGFKVFEVNCSSRRSGRHVLSQLKEATQSHLVEVSGEDPLKPVYFSNYNPSSCTPKPGALHGKLLLPQSVPSASKRTAARNPRSSGRRAGGKAPTVTLAHYFKMKQKADRFLCSGVSQSGRSDGENQKASKPQDCEQTAPQSKKTATSLILFEEVDVIFKDDVGFLAAIKAFTTTTKRPVILTTNDPSFKDRFDFGLEEIIFEPPSAVDVCSYLQLVCLAEEVRLDPDDISSLVGLTCGDVRRCLLQLQLWVHSGGGWASPIGGPTGSQRSEAAVGGGSDPQLPLCRAGCSAYMLGLHPVTPNFLLNVLKSWPETNIDGLLKLLAESWRRDVPLLYSNLELLLSLAAETSLHRLDNKTDSQLQDEPSRSDADRNVGAKTSAPCSNPVRGVSRLSRRRRTASAKSVLTTELRKTPLSPRGTQSGALCSDAGRLVSGSRGSEAFVWTGAAVKDGVLDEMSEEGSGGRSQERLQDVKAAVEGLGFRRASEAWTEAQKHKEWEGLRDTPLLASSSKRQNLSFTAQPLCALSASQRSYKVSRLVLSRKPFSLLGNRQAVTVDYMPVLRFFCAQQQKVEPGRCLNRRGSTHLGLSKSTWQLLAEDFTLEKLLT